MTGDGAGLFWAAFTVLAVEGATGPWAAVAWLFATFLVSRIVRAHRRVTALAARGPL